MQENSTTDVAPTDIPALGDYLRIPANSHFTLFPNQSLLQEGFADYADEHVQHLRLNARKNRMESIVYYPTGSFKVWLSPTDNGVAHKCNCSRWRQDVGCKHAVAAYAMMMHVLQGRSFYFRAPSSEYASIIYNDLVRSASGIAQTKGNAAARQKQKNKVRITAVAESDESGLIFYSDQQEAVELLQDKGFQQYYSGYWLGRDTRRGEGYFHYEINKLLPALADACSQMGIELVLELPGRPHARKKLKVVIKPGLRKVPLRAVMERTAGFIDFSLRSATQTSHPLVWADFGSGIAIDSAGQLFIPTDPAPIAWMDRFISPSDAFESPMSMALGSGIRKEQFRYNTRALHFDLTWSDYSPDTLRLFLEEQPCELPEEPAEAVLTLACYSTRSGAKLVFHVHPLLEIGGSFIDARGILMDFALDLRGQSSFSRLWGAKGRTERLLAAVHNLLLLESKQERSGCIKDAVSHEIFKRPRLSRDARERLREIERNWVERDSSVTVLSSEDEPGDREQEEAPARPRWLLARLPRRQIARAALAIWPIRRQTDLETFGDYIEMPAEEVGQFITQAAAVAAGTGARIMINGDDLRFAPVEIHVEARDSDQIDWFELKAEIRCESLTLTDDQWQALISGQLLLQDQNGQYVVPQIGERVELLQRLRSLGTGNQKSALEARVSRLQILDWLDLRRHGATVRIPQQAEELFNSLQNFRELPASPLPGGIQAQLRPYQHRGYDWLEFLYQHRFGACLADDMGLGKTLQAICFLAAHTPEGSASGHEQNRPHLVVVPPSLLFNWLSELQRFCPRLNVVDYSGSQRDWEAARKASIVLTTYDILRIDQKLFETQPFHIVIFDEAQLVKNLSTARAKAARAVTGRFVLCLTGTPMENHLGEYHAIIDLALPGLMGTAREFNQALKAGEQERLLRRAQPFVLRRTKERILHELPPKVESDLYLDMTPSQKELYTRAVGEVRREVLAAYADKPRQQAGIMALAALTRLRQICVSPALLGAEDNQVSPKFEHLLGDLAEIHGEGHSALIFSQFTRSLDLLQAELSKEGLAYVRLDGSTPNAKRKHVVKTFQESEKPLTFLISLKAGGAGLNLTRASYVFHLDPWWNPAVEHQASDRAHRIGQKQTVFVKRLLMRHTVEEKIQTLKARKQAIFDAVVENPAASRGAGQILTPEDFDFLLNA